MDFRHARRLLAPALAALLAGCAAGPDFHRPKAPANAGYGVDLAAPAAGSDAARFLADTDVAFRWWTAFQSPSLDHLVERAFAQNPSVTSARAALTQANELVSAQRGYFFPSVSVGYTFERQKLAGNQSGSSAPGVQGNGTSINATQNTGPGPHNQPLYYNFHTAAVTVGFVPDLFGANRRRVESLEASAAAARYALEATYVTLAANVVAAAIQEAATRDQLAAVDALIAANRSQLAILTDKAAQGYAMQGDVAAAEGALAGALGLRPPLERTLEQTRDLLRALVGQLPNEDLAERFALRDLVRPAALPVSVPGRLIEQRPDVRMAEEALHAANANVGSAVAAMLPSISISGSAGGTATSFPWMFRSGGPFWNLVGGLTQPVFQGGTLLHEKRAADAALAAAAADYQSTVLAAYQNVADVLHANATDAPACAAAEAAETAARNQLAVVAAREAAGYADALARLAAEVAYQAAVINRVQAEALRFGDVAALYTALGGGWWNRAHAGEPTPAADAPGAASP